MSHETVLLSLAGILFFGIGAQYLAWRLELPAILFLLVLGFLAGPILGVLNPDRLFGPLLMPTISLLVAIILFEGGLSLRFREVREIGRTVVNLLTIGVLATWVLSAVFAFIIFRFDIKLCILLGAVLTVTGPTVIGPLLQHIQPTERVNNILKWEGIIVDPLGALLTFLTFEVIFVQGLNKAWFLIIWGILKTVFLASAVGMLAAGLLIFMMARYWIPDRLHGTFSLMLIVTAFTISNLFQPESGLWAVTIMGVALANQQFVSIRHLEELKENLRILFISSLFIILGARFDVANLTYFNGGSLLFVAMLILFVRPVSVFLSTLRSTIDWKEKAFVSWMAPRGIVAAAVSSIFALRLTELGYVQAAQWEAVVFFVIICTVLIYGVSAPGLAHRLKITNPNPQGVLLVGAHAWARMLAKALQQEGISVLMLDTNIKNISKARREKLPAFYGNALSENVSDDLPLNGIGHLMALTPNNEANSLVVMHFIKLFGRAKVFQVYPSGVEEEEAALYARHLRGRFLFAQEVNSSYLDEKLVNQKGKIERILLSDTATYADFEKDNPDHVALFVVSSKKDLNVFTTDFRPSPKAGDVLLYLKKR